MTLSHQSNRVRYHVSTTDRSYDWIAIDVVAVPSISNLYRVADDLELPRPIWPPAVIDGLLLRELI